MYPGTNSGGGHNRSGGANQQGRGGAAASQGRPFGQASYSAPPYGQGYEHGGHMMRGGAGPMQNFGGANDLSFLNGKTSFQLVFSIDFLLENMMEQDLITEAS